MPGAMRRPILLPPVGIHDFRWICSESFHYVDKTLLIKDLLDFRRRQVTLFTRPRRFGKTLTLNMLRTFFEATDEDTSHLFRDKKIWKTGEEYRRLQGQFPVVFLSFKDVDGADFQTAAVQMQDALHLEYFRHSEKLDTKRLAGWMKERMEVFCNGTPSIEQTRTSIRDLCSIVRYGYGKDPILLIDEYDTPLNNAWMNRYYDEMLRLERGMLSAALKDNSALWLACLTGIQCVAKTSVMSGLNNVRVDTVLSERFDEFFGFTQGEIEQMAQYYGAEERLPEIREWYEGYRFGDVEVYNPWAVLSYFDENCVAAPYWVNTSGNGIIGDVLDFADGGVVASLDRLMRGETIRTKIRTELVYPELSHDPASVYTLLLMAGYLTTCANGSASNEEGDFELMVPNRELRRVYPDEIEKKANKFFASATSAELRRAIEAERPEELQKCLEQLLLESVSHFDLADYKPHRLESLYHIWVLGLLEQFRGKYALLSNRESGKGRFDLCLVPVGSASRDLPGVIIEFKAKKDEEQLRALAREGLEQIHDKQYAAPLHAFGVRAAVMYDVAFSGKDIEVASARSHYEDGAWHVQTHKDDAPNKDLADTNSPENRLDGT